MRRDFEQIEWDERIEAEARRIARIALDEDVGGSGEDWTSVSLVPEGESGSALVVSRARGVAAGMDAARIIAEACDVGIEWRGMVHDGAGIAPGQRLARMSGPARSLLRAERPLLNVLGQLSGIATLTAEYVRRVEGTRAAIYDTRKTLPGFRRLAKWAVRCGGGKNHRLDLSSGVLIKDNHLAFFAGVNETVGTPAEAVHRARELCQAKKLGIEASPFLIEVEVDTFDQFVEVSSAKPDIVLLDNMAPEMLREAVLFRDAHAPEVSLEASGGVNLETVRAIAESGVDRISVGAITHSAPWFDVGLDWE